MGFQGTGAKIYHSAAAQENTKESQTQNSLQGDTVLFLQHTFLGAIKNPVPHI